MSRSLAAAGITGSGASVQSSTIFAAYAGSNNLTGVQAFAASTGVQITAFSDYLDGSESNWSGIETPEFSNWIGCGLRACIGVNMGPDAIFTPGGGNTTSALTAGSVGTYNSHFTAFGNWMVAHGFANAILRVGWEFGANQPWSPTSSSDPPLYAAYWRQIVTTLRAVSGQAFAFDWNPLWGFTSQSETAAYPGDAYVDIISVDMYDQSYNATCFPPSGEPGNTATITQSNCAFNDMLTTGSNGVNSWLSMQQSHGKRFAVPEWGVNNDQGGASGHGLGDDPQFITNMSNFKIANNPYYMSYFAFDYGTPGVSGSCFNITDGLFPNALARYKSLFG